MMSILAGKGSLVFDSVSLGRHWTERGLLWSWAFEYGGETSVPTILRRFLTSRCVTLQIQLTCNSVDGELLEHPLLLMDLEKHLLKVEENFIRSGYKKKCVDLKLEHARIKK